MSCFVFCFVFFFQKSLKVSTFSPFAPNGIAPYWSLKECRLKKIPTVFNLSNSVPVCNRNSSCAHARLHCTTHKPPQGVFIWDGGIFFIGWGGFLSQCQQVRVPSPSLTPTTNIHLVPSPPSCSETPAWPLPPSQPPHLPPLSVCASPSY